MMDLRFNKASVNSAWDVWGVTNNKIFKWFDFFELSDSPSGTTSASFVSQPYLSVSVRVAWKKRMVDVKFQTVQEMISEISGSWTISLLVGGLLALALKHGGAKARARERTRRQSFTEEKSLPLETDTASTEPHELEAELVTRERRISADHSVQLRTIDMEPMDSGEVESLRRDLLALTNKVKALEQRLAFDRVDRPGNGDAPTSTSSAVATEVDVQSEPG